MTKAPRQGVYTYLEMPHSAWAYRGKKEEDRKK